MSWAWGAWSWVWWVRGWCLVTCARVVLLLVLVVNLLPPCTWYDCHCALADGA